MKPIYNFVFVPYGLTLPELRQVDRVNLTALKKAVPNIMGKRDRTNAQILIPGRHFWTE